MKWHKTEPAKLDRRIVKRFLLWPLCLNGEYRWMEWACINQLYDYEVKAYNYKQYKWRDHAYVTDMVDAYLTAKDIHTT